MHTAGDRVAGAALWGRAGRWHRDLRHRSACCVQVWLPLRSRLDPTRLLLAPVGKQDLGRSVMIVHPIFPLFMARKVGELMLDAYIPELGGFFFSSVSYF